MNNGLLAEAIAAELAGEAYWEQRALKAEQELKEAQRQLKLTRKKLCCAHYDLVHERSR